MKKVFMISFLLMMSIVISGCLQIQTKVYVNKDGSGIFEETILIKDEIIEMMKHFAVAFDSSQSEEFNLFNEEELISKAAKYGEGVSFDSSEKIKANGYEGVIAKYSFSDISKLNLSLVSEDSFPMMGEEDSQKDSGDLLKFGFSKNNGLANLKIYLPTMNHQDEEFEQEMSDSSSAEEFEKVKQLFTDMKISLIIIPSGKIQQTNADYIQNNEITLLEMNMNSLLEKPELFKDLWGNKVKTLDEVKKMVKDIEGFKIDSHDIVEINF